MSENININVEQNTAELTKGDLYYRKDIVNDGKKHPLIIYFHGGGFIMGDKKRRVSICEFYANEGYFVYNVIFRGKETEGKEKIKIQDYLKSAFTVSSISFEEEDNG